MANKHSCEMEIQTEYPDNAQAYEGRLWKCSCGKTYTHVCDEAEGCYWQLLTKHRRPHGPLATTPH